MKRCVAFFALGLLTLVFAGAVQSDDKKNDDKKTDKKTDVDKDKGDKPKDKGDKPKDKGDKPKDKGDKPKDKGDKPKDDAPKDKGDKPKDKGDKPKDKGDKPKDKGDKPKDKPTDKKPEPVKALPSNPLDDAFKNVGSERDILNALLNNDLYKKAVAEAYKAKTAQEQKARENPKLVGPTPAQAARQRFLEVLRGESKGGK